MRQSHDDDPRRSFLRKARSHLKRRIERWNESQIHDVISDGQSLLVSIGSRLQWYIVTASKWMLMKELPRRDLDIKQLCDGRILYADGLVFNLNDGRELQLHGVDFYIWEDGWLALESEWSSCDWSGNCVWRGAGQRVSNFLFADGELIAQGNDRFGCEGFSPIHAILVDEELFTVGLHGTQLQLRTRNAVLKQLRVGSPSRWYLSMDHSILVYDDTTRIVRLTDFASCLLNAVNLSIIPNDYAFDRDSRQFIKLHFD